MDDIALNPDYYDLFSEPAFVITTFVWLAALLIFRAINTRLTDITFYFGAFMVCAAVVEPVFLYAKAEVPLLVAQTREEWQTKSADPLRARDPFFSLLRLYLQANPSHPLIVVAPKDEDTLRWARYYLAPRPVLTAKDDQLANVVPGPDEPGRWVLTNGMPRVPADADITIEGRVDDWILFRLQPRSTQ